jgi:predicted alpha/beta-fold hydrolase
VWESLATNARQDRVLHGAAKVANVLVGVTLLPLWFLGQRLAGPLASWLDRSGGRPALPSPSADGERDLDAVVAELQAIPHRLRPWPLATLRKGIPDTLLFLLVQKRQTMNLGYSYPRQFEYHRIEGADGVPIAASVAVHDEPRPGLVVVHGLFSTRHFDYVRKIAVRAYYEWGFNVAAIDLRSFGVTELLSPAPSTAGWKEGEDIVAAAEHLKSLGSTSVGAIGISLGASSVLNASYADGAEAALDGGVLAICGPSDTRVAAERLDRPVRIGHPAYPIKTFFDMMLVSKVRNLRWPADVAGFTTLVEDVVAPYYGLTADDIWERSSAKNHIGKTSVPLLALHGEDDDVIPVKHARMLEEAASGNPNVRVWIVPGGAHAAFDVLDSRWTYAVYRRFFEAFASYEAAAPVAVIRERARPRSEASPRRPRRAAS